MLFNTLLLAGTVQAVLPIVSYGNKLYQVNEDYTKPGTEFKVIGVDYQPGGSSSFQVDGSSDLLSDASTCMRDAYVLQQLGVNTIRIYSVSPWLNHDECMTIFNNAGIYVVLDLANPYQALARTNTSDSYNSGLLNNVFGLVDAFKYYPNLLGFFSGNEVVNDDASAASAPKYIRALQRDIKQYISLHANRTIPVGYSTADDLTLRVATWEYLQCGDDVSKSDFFGINSYEWCSGSSDWTSSGYGTIESTFNDSSIPIFFSEYGCNKNEPRTFDEVTQGVFKQDEPTLDGTLVGGLIYEYSEESNEYGLVDIDSNGNIKYRPDFANLQKQYSQIQLTTATQPSSAPGGNAPNCSSSLISGLSTDFDWDMNLPDCPDSDALKNGGGNQNVGKIVDISHLQSNYTIQDNDGNQQDGNINWISSNQVNWQYNVPAKSSGSSSAAASSTSSSATASSSSSKSKSKNNAEAYTGASLLAGVFAAVMCFV